MESESGALLVGTWHYGKKTSKYTITPTESGGLRFAGPFKQETVSGILKRGAGAEFWQAELFLKNGQRAGSIRLRFDVALQAVASKFRPDRSEANWGKDIIAHREGSPNLPVPSEIKKEQPLVAEINPEEALILVGECNKWNVSAALRSFHFTLEKSPAGRVQSRLRLDIDNNDFQFQILSASQQWNWRLYPCGAQNILRLDDITRIPVAWLCGSDHRAAEHRNFCINGKKGSMVDVLVEVQSTAQLVWCKCAEGKSPEQQRWKVVNPKDLAFRAIQPLQLVGSCCRWNHERKGLSFLTSGTSQVGREEHQMCVEIISGEIAFQVVSQPMGFKWRLFPRTGESLCLREKSHCECQLGGEDDGHQLNFVIREPICSIVVITVRLHVTGEQINDCSIWYARRPSLEPQVGIGRLHIEYPPRKKSVLESTRLEAAQTDEERNDILQQRLTLIRRICWQTRDEYSRENVQREVLALRLYYPYHKKKSVFALEFDASGEKIAIAGLSSSDSAHASSMQADTLPEALSPSSKNSRPRLAPETTYQQQTSCERSERLPEPRGGNVQNSNGHIGDTMFDFDALDDQCEGKPDSAAQIEVSPEPCALGPDSPRAYRKENDAEGFEEIDDSFVPKSNGIEQRSITQLKSDFETRLKRTQDKIRRLELQIEHGSDGVSAVLLEQMRNEEKAFKIAVKDVQRYSSADDAWVEFLEKFNRSMHATTLLGDADAQWWQAVNKLPSVVAARLAVAAALGISEREVKLGLLLGEELRGQDMQVFESVAIIQTRLRIHAGPHPDLVQQTSIALKKDGAWVGTPEQFFHMLDVSNHADWMHPRADLEVAWKEGAFNCWFGGPRSGRYCVMCEEDMFTKQWFALAYFVIGLKDHFKSLIRAMGDDGNDLHVEPRVMLTFHNKDDSLPPRIDNLGQSRVLTFMFNLSLGQGKAKDGGALKLCPRQSQKNSRKIFDVPAGGGHACVFFTQDFKQEISQVKLPCGRWSISLCAERMKSTIPNAPTFARHAKTIDEMQGKHNAENDNYSALTLTCDSCGFSAGDGIMMTCKHDHRVCRDCIQKEIRKSLVATCPACIVDDGDPVSVASMWDLFASESVEDVGCVCSQEAVDPGAIVIISGQRKESQLNGKLAEAVWWSMETNSWDVRVFATGEIISIPKVQLHALESCASGGCSLSKCPCWPHGRGIIPISVGCRCCAKQGIMDCTAFNEVPQGYPYWHGNEFFPFDWNLTSLDGILFFLRHDFANFFHFNAIKTVKAVNNAHITFQNYTSSLMSFLHHSPVKDRPKLEHRMQRWRVLCNHSREVRAARTVLFIRYLHESSEFARIDELYSLLRLWAGGRVRLCIVCMLQTDDDSPRLYRHARFPRVLIYLAGHIDVMNWEPIRKVCRFAAYDEVGLLQCESVEMSQLPLRIFRDPYTTLSRLCEEGDWLDPLQNGEDHAFFPDCPACKLPWQGSQKNALLAQAIKSGRCSEVEALVWFHAKPCAPTAMADANSWDQDGRRPLHHAVGLAPSSISKAGMVRMVAVLLLARADPRCYDRRQVTVLEHARSVHAPAEICALLEAVSLAETRVDTVALYSALEMLGEPIRSRLARILDVGGVRPVGAAEFAWRNPSPESEEFIEEVEEALGHLERLPEMQRKKEMKRLLLEWHPDKNTHRHELATAVFQYLQANRDRIVRR